MTESISEEPSSSSPRTSGDEIPVRGGRTDDSRTSRSHGEPVPPTERLFLPVSNSKRLGHWEELAGGGRVGLVVLGFLGDG